MFTLGQIALKSNGGSKGGGGGGVSLSDSNVERLFPIESSVVCHNVLWGSNRNIFNILIKVEI